MWLMHTVTAGLWWFVGDAIPEYAILSHVWSEHGEQEFQATRKLLSEPTGCLSAPYGPLNCGFPQGVKLSSKVQRCCEFAARLGYHLAWIDTCCIDKSSSTQLSEAINSMFLWYSEAGVCIAYLEDVPDAPHRPEDLVDAPLDLVDVADADLDSTDGVEISRGPTAHSDPPLDRAQWHLRFSDSKWFRGGWTLQELIAPHVVLFVSENWRMFGTKATLAQELERITGIDAAVLTFHQKLSEVSIAQRMRWASQRKTKRIEDRAYSLQGLFGVTMPAIYGEGDAAFIRLQEEIMKLSPDQTLFTWQPAFPHTDSHANLLAASPSFFESGRRMESIPMEEIPKAVETLCTAIAGTADIVRIYCLTTSVHY